MKLCCVPNFGVTRVGPRLFAEQHVVRFLDELAHELGDVVLCAPEIAGHEGSRHHGYEITGRRGIVTVARPFSTSQRLRFYVSSVAWLLPAILRTDFLYVFLPGRLGVVAAAIATLVRRPYGVYLRGSQIDLFGSVRALSGARFVLAAGPYLRDVAARYCRRSDMVAPMLDLAAGDLAAARVQRPRRDTWRLLYVGALDEAKGTFELLQAMDLLRARGVPVQLDLVGNWVGEEMARRAEAAFGAREAVRFRGAVDDRDEVRAYYRDADLFVFPSHSEGFPRVLYEAMCFGVPIVTTMVDGIPSLMRAGTNCVGVPVRNAAALAEAIEKTLADAPLRGTLAGGGIETMRSVFAAHTSTHAGQVVERVRQAAHDHQTGGRRQ